MRMNILAKFVLVGFLGQFFSWFISPAQALNAPTGLTATKGQYDDRIIISWNAVTGANGYKVYKSFNSSDQCEGTYLVYILTGTSANHGLNAPVGSPNYAVPGTVYYYTVRAVADNGANGTCSQSVAGWRSPPNAPTNPSGASDGSFTDHIRVHWTHPTASQQPYPVPNIYDLRYFVYRSSTCGGQDISSGGLASNLSELLDYEPSVIPGKNYSYSVKAVRGNMSNGGDGTSTCANVGTGYKKMSPPTGVAASSSAPNSLRVTWVPPQTALGGPNGVTHYRLYSATGGSLSQNTCSDSQQIFEFPSSQTSYGPTTGTAPGTYHFKLKSKGENGSLSDCSAGASVTVNSTPANTPTYTPTGTPTPTPTISLPPPPSNMSINSPSQPVIAGNPAPYSCSVSGSSITWEWSRTFPNGAVIALNCGTSGNSSNCTVFTDPTENGSNIIRCTAANSGGSISAQAVLTLIAPAQPPTNVQITSSQVVQVGQPATFMVLSYQGAPLTQFQWLRNSVEIPGANTSQYTLAQTTTSDNNARFQVRVYNSAGGPALSNEGVLTVTTITPTPTNTPTNNQTPTLLRPILECVTAPNAEGFRTAWFGYENTSGAELNVPVSGSGESINAIVSPGNITDLDREQPTIFLPGRVRYSFRTEYFEYLAWSLQVPGSTPESAYAGPDSPLCTSITEPVVPSLSCVSANFDGTFTARFGYSNTSSGNIIIPAGEMNRFSPEPENRGQSQLFLSGGAMPNAFEVIFDGSPITWRLGQLSVEASSISTACPNIAPICNAGGPYQSACVGLETTIPLNGLSSTDPDGPGINYAWSTDCANATLLNPETPQPSLVLRDPGLGTAANCLVTLSVNDGTEVITCNAGVNVSACAPITPTCTGVVDRCGVCNGNNACVDCAGVPFGNNLACLDCAGVLSGTATRDRCGVCQGSGASCLGCLEVNVLPIQEKLVDSTLKLKTMIRAGTRALINLGAKSNKKGMKFVRSLRLEAKAREESMRNLIFTYPGIVLNCTNTTFCRQIDNVDIGKEINALAGLQQKLIERISKRVRKSGNTVRARRLKNRAKSIRTRIRKDVETLPRFNSNCR